MVKNKIDNKYIYRIIFKSEEDMLYVKKIIGDFNIKLVVDPIYFKTRTDYMNKVLGGRAR